MKNPTMEDMLYFIQTHMREGHVERFVIIRLGVLSLCTMSYTKIKIHSEHYHRTIAYNTIRRQHKTLKKLYREYKDASIK